MHPCVDLPDSSYTLVPKGGGGGADGDVHYVAEEQDLYQSPQGPRPTLMTKASHESLTSLSKTIQLPCYVCAFTFQELNETLDA
jgi:hypothetical protein